MPFPKNNLLSRKNLLGLAITVAALFMVLRKVDVAALARVFGSMDYGWFAGAIAVFGVALMCAAWRWHLMLRLTGCPVHLLAAARVYYIGACLGFIFFGPAVGDVAKSVLYSKWFRRPLPRVIASAPIDRMLGIGGLLMFCIPALALAAAKGVFAPGGTAAGFKVPVPLLAVGIMAGVAGLVMIFKWRPKSDSAFAHTFNSFAESVTKLIASPRLAAPGLALGFCVQTLSCVVFALCLKSVTHGAAPWLEMLWTFPVIGAMTSLPSVGGLGVREAAAASLLRLYRIPAADAVAASLLVMGVTFFWAIIGGIVLFREGRRFDLIIEPTPSNEPGTISVVIPTINEAAELPETLRRVKAIPEVIEIIVADGGSFDGTAGVAEKNGARVVVSPPGRGQQLRVGAGRAVGDIVLLLHADTWVPPEAGQAILNCLRDSSVVGGGFWKVFRPGSSLAMRGSRFKCFVRLVLGRRLMGDQAIFIRREVLAKIGGVPGVSLMEEFELCKRLREVGRLAIADAVVVTSARRFEKLGPLRTYARMWSVTVRYYLGASPEELRRRYEK